MLVPTIHPANRKPLASNSTDVPPHPHRTPSLNPTLNIYLASKENLSSTAASQPGRNYRSLSFLKQIKHGQYTSACQALPLTLCFPLLHCHSPISPARTPDPHWDHCLNFTASGILSWPKQLPQESLLLGSDGSPRQQLSSGWLLNAPLGWFLFVFSVPDCNGEGKPRQAQVNLTKYTQVTTM